jgi:hypothetical protein
VVEIELPRPVENMFWSHAVLANPVQKTEVQLTTCDEKAVPLTISTGDAVITPSSQVSTAPRYRDSTSAATRQNKPDQSQACESRAENEERLTVFDEKAVPIAKLAAHAITPSSSGNLIAPRG